MVNYLWIKCWSYGSPVFLELSYYICDDKDEPFVVNLTFKRYNHPPYVNSSVLLLERASTLFDWMCG